MNGESIRDLARRTRDLIRSRVLWIRRKALMAAELAAIRDTPAGLPVNFRFGGQADVDAMSPEEHDYDAGAKAFSRERLEKGDRLVVGERDGQVRCYGWVMFGAMDMSLRKYRPLPAGCAYVYKLFTVNDCRGAHILPALYTFLRRVLPDAGVQRLVSWIRPANVPSLRAHLRAGFRPAGMIWEIRCFSRLWHVLSPGARRSLKP